MSLVYTSGTSGLPKGAMLTYGAFNWSVQQLINHIGIERNDRLFSYLPLAHITERVYIFGCSITGWRSHGVSRIARYFYRRCKDARPTLFISVPRLWTLFQQRIQDKLPQKNSIFYSKYLLLTLIIKKKLADGLGL